MKYLLDTNILSEWWKPNLNQQVIAFLESGGWLVPSPVIAEIQEGAESAHSVAWGIEINAQLDRFIGDFEEVVLAFDHLCARTWARLRHTAEVKRQPQALWDSLIEAMAVQNGLIVATRNAKDFRHAQTFNPFSA